jgi:hypothetical protein
MTTRFATSWPPLATALSSFLSSSAEHAPPARRQQDLRIQKSLQGPLRAAEQALRHEWAHSPSSPRSIQQLQVDLMATITELLEGLSSDGKDSPSARGHMQRMASEAHRLGTRLLSQVAENGTASGSRLTTINREQTAAQEDFTEVQLYSEASHLQQVEQVRPRCLRTTCTVL